MIFYFSGTGNSKWIAEQFARVLDDTLVFIPEALRHGQFEFSLDMDERIGFIFPIYSWGPPAIVLHFIQQLSLLGYQRQYMYFICSCGDDVGLTQQVFEKTVSMKGWSCNAGYSVIMPNSYVLLPGFDVDSQEVEARKLENAKRMVPELVSKIGQRKEEFSLIEGSVPFVKTRIIRPLFNRYQMSPKKFYATDACIGCKCCEKVCPIGNVSVNGKKPEWGMECTACLACYHVCPQQALQYGNRTKKKGQYYYIDV